MGRHPFQAWANIYLDGVRVSYAEATVVEYERRYRRMYQVLNALKDQGRVSTTNPEKITAEDILAYISHLKAGGMSESGIQHNLSPLVKLIERAKNTEGARFKREFPHMVPKRRTARLPPLAEDKFQAILQEADRVREDDWRRLEAYALVVLALCAGMRNKELRLSNVTNIDLSRELILAEHVKGEGSYGGPRYIPIRPEAIGIFRKYLRARNKQVELNCPNNLALFPALRDKGDGYLSTNGTIELKSIVEKEVGCKFDFRMCRRTYAQKVIDEDLPPDSLSLIMGHSSTKTTETYYARKRNESAIRDVQKIWKQGSSIPSAKTSKIELKNEVTGYA